jgi:hypothetical protein
MVVNDVFLGVGLLLCHYQSTWMFILLPGGQGILKRD